MGNKLPFELLDDHGFRNFKLENQIRWLRVELWIAVNDSLRFYNFKFGVIQAVDNFHRDIAIAEFGVATIK